MLISNQAGSLKVASGSGRKKVKMKPPWHLSELDKKIMRRKGKKQIKVIALELIITALVILIACDKTCWFTAAWAYAIITGDAPSRSGEQSQVEQQSSQASDLASQSPLSLPYFNTTGPNGSPSSLVIGSSYQNEIYLSCPILNLDEEQTVSWIRKRDSLVLTIDKLRLIDDNRFQLSQMSEDWTLVLSQPSDLDAGIYECQVSSMEPKLSHLVELRMIPAESSISNFSSLFVRPNDLINLTCTIEAPQRTSYVYWYKNKDVIYFDKLVNEPIASSVANRSTSLVTKSSSYSKPRTHRSNVGAELLYDDDLMYDSVQTSRIARPSRSAPGMKVTKYGQTRQQTSLPSRWSPPSSNNNNTAQPAEQFALATSSSTLIIKQAQLSDTANYTCLPSNAKPSQIRVIVIENGLGSQPEKRSLQADSALSSLGSMPSLWFRKLKLVSLLIAAELQNPKEQPRTTNLVTANKNTHWPTALLDLFMDQSLIWLALSFGMVIYVGLMQ